MPAASKLADLIATGRAPAAASRKSVSQAFSPCAGDVLFAILDSIRTADLRPAVENFLVETCKRVSVPADQGRETDTISTIFSLMQKQVSQACEGLGIEPEVAQTVLDKMIPYALYTITLTLPVIAYSSSSRQLEGATRRPDRPHLELPAHLCTHRRSQERHQSQHVDRPKDHPEVRRKRRGKL